MVGGVSGNLKVDNNFGYAEVNQFSRLIVTVVLEYVGVAKVKIESKTCIIGRITEFYMSKGYLVAG